MRFLKHILVLVWLAAAGCASTPTTPPATPALPTSAQAGATTIVAVAPPAAECCPKLTLPEFLGINGLFKALGGGIDRIRNRLGNRFPGLEATPPLLSITDPANLSADSPPAVKAAAEAKAEEDAAPQKAKAIRYLATLGCTDCYPNVETALLEAMSDCTESIRYEAVLAIRKVCGGPCKSCTANECCSDAIIKKLDELANHRDDEGCFKEPSARVRRIARLALACCGGPYITTTLPAEGPSEQQLPAPESEGSVASQWDPLPGLNAPVARVNGDPIWKRDVLQAVEIQLAAAMVRGNGSQEEPTPAMFEAELYRIIDRKLLFQAALREERVGGNASLASHESSGSVADPGRGVRTTDASGASSVQNERQVAAEWLARHAEVGEIVSRQELYNFYRAHSERYRQSSAVRWEHTFASYDRFGRREQAEAAVQFLRNAALGHAGSPPPELHLAAVEARAHGWTQRENLPSPSLAPWLFSLPVGKLSPLIHDEQGIHLVRVLEQRPPQLIPLEEAADDIRREIIQQRREAAEQAYLRNLRRQAEVWTIFDAASSEH